jgi:uncharacterized protein (TIGR00645 family)
MRPRVAIFHPARLSFARRSDILARDIAIRTPGEDMRKIERFIETILFQSRWVLAPFYLGLAFCLLLLLGHFARELVMFVIKIPAAKDSDVILGVLALIDLAFTGNLVLIVIFSGYENFVSKIEIEGHDRPDWMTKVDFGGLKQKLMTSIVAISANVDQAETVNNTKLAWLVGMHVLFLGSLLGVVLADRWSESSKPPEEKADPGR